MSMGLDKPGSRDFLVWSLQYLIMPAWVLSVLKDPLTVQKHA